jgi:glycosyltransferase involved in cell wall biosynthesis
MRISASLIVKNESDHLRECLNSISGVDEIVIVDTGSTDDTVDIAKEYTDLVYYGEDYLWKDDFAHSRNQSMELCTGDWILIIDADEVLEPGGITKLRSVIQSIETNGLYFNTISLSDNLNVHKSIRAFKNGYGRWMGRAHNYLVGLTTSEVDISIYYGYSKAHNQDPDRTLRILKKTCEDDPHLTRERYYLAREYWYRKDYHNATIHWKKYLEKSTFLSEKSDAYLMLARCAWLTNQGSEARNMCLEAIRINPDFKEALLFMSEIHYEPWKSKWKKIADLATNQDVLFVRC